MNINKINGFNNAFVGTSSARPIVGHLTKQDFLNTVQQAKVGGSVNLVAGDPIALKTIVGEGNANYGLNPNVFVATKASADGSDIAGFILANNTDIVTQDSDVPLIYPTQIANVAIIGSGVEIYLPISSSATTLLSGEFALNSNLIYDNTTGAEGLKIGTSGTLKAVSNVLDGVKYTADGFVECKVLKVRI